MNPAMPALISPMLTPIVILVIRYIRRRLKRAGNTMPLIVNVFMEMQEMRRAAQLRYPHLDL